MKCLPIVEAGQALLVDDTYASDDTVWLTPSPGHTPGHCNVNVRSRGMHAVMIGDLIHHALQVREPDWTTRFFWNPEMTVRSRKRFLEEVANTATIVLPTHFPSPTAGNVIAQGGQFRYRFQAKP
ncbi:MAG: hypothetical protein EXR28_05410 [Betaproteobacteria bacterium]|nr:hypothetical protein [Betaproteobacteria bacterium]